MKKLYRYFGFSLAEQRGFLVLLVLICISILFPYFLSIFQKEELIHHQLITWEETEDNKSEFHDDSRIDYSSSKSAKIDKSKIHYFEFDPNGLSAENWKKLGFSDRQIQGIKNYEAKGGKFYKKADVAKMYTISDADYKRIEPYITIASIEKNINTYEAKTFSKPTVNSYDNLSVDINTADTSDFKLLKGIGSTLSNRIVKYRNALGGFHDVNQIKEVYGLPEETFLHIFPKLKLSNSVAKLKINEVDATTLARHPYISNKLAQQIVNYRAQHGNYVKIENLSNLALIDQDFLRKIEPYLEF